MNPTKICQKLTINSSEKKVSFPLRKNTRITFEEAMTSCMEKFSVPPEILYEKYSLFYSDLSCNKLRKIRNTEELQSTFKKEKDKSDQDGTYLYSSSVEFGLIRPNLLSLSPDEEDEEETDPIIIRLQQKNAKLEGNFHKLKERFVALETNLKTSEKRCAELKEENKRIRDINFEGILAENNKLLIKEMKMNEKLESDLRTENSKLKEENDKIKEENRGYKEREVLMIKRNQEIDEKLKRIEEVYSKENQSLLLKIDEKEKDIKDKEASILKLNEDLTVAKEKLELNEKEHSKNIESLINDVTESNDKFIALIQKEKETIIENSNKEINDLKKQFDELKVKSDILKGELETKIKENYDDFNKSIKDLTGDFETKLKTNNETIVRHGLNEAEKNTLLNLNKRMDTIISKEDNKKTDEKLSSVLSLINDFVTKYNNDKVTNETKLTNDNQKLIDSVKTLINDFASKNEEKENTKELKTVKMIEKLEQQIKLLEETSKQNNLKYEEDVKKITSKIDTGNECLSQLKVIEENINLNTLKNTISDITENLNKVLSLNQKIGKEEGEDDNRSKDLIQSEERISLNTILTSIDEILKTQKDTYKIISDQANRIENAFKSSENITEIISKLDEIKGVSERLNSEISKEIANICLKTDTKYNETLESMDKKMDDICNNISELSNKIGSEVDNVCRETNDMLIQTEDNLALNEAEINVGNVSTASDRENLNTNKSLKNTFDLSVKAKPEIIKEDTPKNPEVTEETQDKKENIITNNNINLEDVSSKLNEINDQMKNMANFGQDLKEIREQIMLNKEIKDALLSNNDIICEKINGIMKENEVIKETDKKLIDIKNIVLNIEKLLNKKEDDSNEAHKNEGNLLVTSKINQIYECVKNLGDVKDCFKRINDERIKDDIRSKLKENNASLVKELIGLLNSGKHESAELSEGAKEFILGISNQIVDCIKGFYQSLLKNIEGNYNKLNDKISQNQNINAQSVNNLMAKITENIEQYDLKHINNTGQLKNQTSKDDLKFIDPLNHTQENYMKKIIMKNYQTKSNNSNSSLTKQASNNNKYYNSNPNQIMNKNYCSICKKQTDKIYQCNVCFETGCEFCLNKHKHYY